MHSVGISILRTRISQSADNLIHSTDNKKCKKLENRHCHFSKMAEPIWPPKQICVVKLTCKPIFLYFSQKYYHSISIVTSCVSSLPFPLGKLRPHGGLVVVSRLVSLSRDNKFRNGYIACIILSESEKRVRGQVVDSETFSHQARSDVQFSLVRK